MYLGSWDIFQIRLFKIFHIICMILNNNRFLLNSWPCFCVVHVLALFWVGRKLWRVIPVKHWQMYFESGDVLQVPFAQIFICTYHLCSIGPLLSWTEVVESHPSQTLTDELWVWRRLACSFCSNFLLCIGPF